MTNKRQYLRYGHKLADGRFSFQNILHQTINKMANTRQYLRYGHNLTDSDRVSFKNILSPSNQKQDGRQTRQTRGNISGMAIISLTVTGSASRTFPSNYKQDGRQTRKTRGNISQWATDSGFPIFILHQILNNMATKHNNHEALC